MYFGKHTDDSEFKGLPIFGLLGIFRKWQESNHITSKTFNHLPSLLFFGSAVPLIFITTRSNDTSVTTTVAGLMAFVYLIATMINNQQIANKTTKNEIAKTTIKSKRNADTARLCELFRSRSEEEQALIIELLFWHKTIAHYTNGNFSEEILDNDIWRGMLHQFNNSHITTKV